MSIALRDDIAELASRQAAMDAPMREVQAHGFEPLSDTRLAGVNLLASTDQTHNDRPGFVPIEIRDEEVGFRSVEVDNLLSAAHEIRGFCLGPGTLRFIEDDDVIVGSLVVRTPSSRK